MKMGLLFFFFFFLDVMNINVHLMYALHISTFEAYIPGTWMPSNLHQNIIKLMTLL